jgi:hypothetical protein
LVEKYKIFFRSYLEGTALMIRQILSSCFSGSGIYILGGKKQPRKRQTEKKWRSGM